VGALEAIAETLASEAAAFDIKVTLVEPGAADTAGANNPPASGPPLGEDPYAPALQGRRFDIGAAAKART
jgi:NAD(P)-dependent dehydrogenase (short-subunit alcohol dehydrogenase family)